VFLTCFTGVADNGDPAKMVRHLLCFDRKDGKLLWDQGEPAKLPEDYYDGMLREHGYASSTPVSDGQHVFAFYGKSGVYAYDLEGKQLWHADVGDGLGMNGWGSAASPLLYDNLLIVCASAESKAIIAFDKTTGKEVWRTPADSLYPTWGTPVLLDAPGGKKELVIGAPFEIWALNPANGNFRWFAEGNQDNTINTSTVAAGDVVYSAGGRSGGGVAIRSGGRDDVTKTHTVWKKQFGTNIPSPVYYKGKLYGVSDRGIVSAVNAETGDELFQGRLSGAGSIYASPVAADGKLYVVTRRKGVYVVAAGDKFEQLAHNELASDESDFSGSPAVSDGRLYLRSAQALYCIGAK
jgi:outer membrane protein assembly factor BamB